MKIGALKSNDEPFVSIVPSVAGKLLKDGYEVCVESGAGDASFYPDQQFVEAGARILGRKEILAQVDILFAVSSVQASDLVNARENAILIGKFNGVENLEGIEQFRESRLRVVSLDLLPRSTLAQSMDVLSSLASLAGYKAVIVAADRFPGYFPMMTTAAGTIPPAKVLILGAGVAGLQAIATAKRLGAVVEVFDVRSAVKEEVESLGARFIEVAGSVEKAEAGGYAVSQSEDYLKRQKSVIHEKALKSTSLTRLCWISTMLMNHSTVPMSSGFIFLL